jgi:biotin carboxylase
MSEWIIFLGASRDQVEGIKACQRLGYRVIAFDRDVDALVACNADAICATSTTDVEGILAEFKRSCWEGDTIAGVLTMGSDIPHIVAELAEHFGVPSVSRLTAHMCTNKNTQRWVFHEKKVPQPYWWLCKSYEKVAAFGARNGWPCVIKPVDRSGSRGVYRLEGSENIEELFRDSRFLSPCGEVIAEDWIDGTQLSTETVMQNGRALATFIAERNYEHLERFAPRVIENGGWMPSLLNEEQIAKTKATIEAAALALGITDGIAKGDLVYHPERGPVVIEMACRLSGGHMSDGLIPLWSGYPILEAAARLAVGKQPPEINPWHIPFPERHICNRYFFPPPGRLVAIWGLEQVEAQPWVHKVEVWPEVGDELPEIRSHADRSGVFVLEAPDRETMAQRIDWVYDTLLLEVEI